MENTERETTARKAAQRRLARQRRDGLPGDLRARYSARIGEHFLHHFGGSTARCVALYASTAHEVDTGPLHEGMRARGVLCCYPRVHEASGRLDFVAVDDTHSLQRGSRGLLEPLGEPLQLSTIDLFVLPGLAFDRAGHRLGQGRGCYDRTLGTARAPRVGVTFSVCVLETVAWLPHDLDVHAVVDENQVHWCNAHSRALP